MSNTKNVYINKRPKLTVELSGGTSLGNCYSASYYKVTSSHPLSMKDLTLLREAGFLGYGQEFYVKQVIGDDRIGVPAALDWQTSPNVKASGHDVIECSEVSNQTGEVVRVPAINPYSNEPYKPHTENYYIYACESRVDSSD